MNPAYQVTRLVRFYALVVFALGGLLSIAHAVPSVTLTWDENLESDVVGYIVYYGTTSGDYTEMLNVGNKTTATISNLTSGIMYYFVVTAYNSAGLESLPTNEISVLPAESPVAANNTVASGLSAEYFDDENLSNLVLSRLDATVDFSWGSSSPDQMIPSDGFSVRWSGSVQALYSETYTFYTVSDDGVRLWVNGELLIDNWSNHPSTEDMGTILLTAGKKCDIVMEYYENSGDATARLLWSSPSQAKEIVPESALTSDATFANQAPVAVDDSFIIDEGATATINALSNDTDPDNGPYALSIQSATSTVNGTTSIVANNLIYTPFPGFFGTDSLSYTISDGDLTATATVTVNVQSTAKANNLTGSGLTGTNIGLVSGASRIQFDDSWELTADGTGVGGIADNVYLEHANQTGNFQVIVRIQNLTSSGAAPEVGLMLRENNAANARFAMLAATPNGYSYGSRTITNGTSSKTALNAPTPFPDVWLLIERNGDSIDFATSSDGINFDLVGSTVIASLADEVDLGLFLSSGTVGVNARADVTDYTVTEITSASVASGLNAEYFDDINLTNLAFTRLDATVDFSWGPTSPDAAALPSDGFSVRWSGSVQALYSETYTFYTVSDDGVRLWVNGELLIDNWSNHPSTEDMGTIPLAAGQNYDIVMEYYENSGDATARLLWSSPNQPKEIIPESALTTVIFP